MYGENTATLSEVPMNCKCLFAPACISAAGLAAVLGMFAMGQPAKDAKPANPHAIPISPTTPAHPATPAGQPEMKLPPGWTAEDMQSCMAAGMPGEMHKHLAKSAGTWIGKCTMWMGPGMDAMPTTICTSTNAMILDGKYATIEHKGDMPGMGPFEGRGLVGFDNVSQKFVGTWIDSMTTGIMNGVGELSKDGKVLTWNYTFNCPITKKPAIMREIETYTSPTTMTLEMHMTDPKSGKEYKMMSIEFKKK